MNIVTSIPLALGITAGLVILTYAIRSLQARSMARRITNYVMDNEDEYSPAFVMAFAAVAFQAWAVWYFGHDQTERIGLLIFYVAVVIPFGVAVVMVIRNTVTIADNIVSDRVAQLHAQDRQTADERRLADQVQAAEEARRLAAEAAAATPAETGLFPASPAGEPSAAPTQQ